MGAGVHDRHADRVGLVDGERERKPLDVGPLEPHQQGEAEPRTQGLGGVLDVEMSALVVVEGGDALEEIAERDGRGEGGVGAELGVGGGDEGGRGRGGEGVGSDLEAMVEVGGMDELPHAHERVERAPPCPQVLEIGAAEMGQDEQHLCLVPGKR